MTPQQTMAAPTSTTANNIVSMMSCLSVPLTGAYDWFTHSMLWPR